MTCRAFLGVQWNDPFTKCILFMYNLLYTIFVLPQTSVWHYDSQFSHLKVQHLREFNTCFNHKTSINASSNWIDIFKTKQEPKQSCSFKIWSRERAYTIQNSSNSVSLICSVQSEDCSLGLQWSVRSLQYLILRTFKIMDEFWWASFNECLVIWNGPVLDEF